MVSSNRHWRWLGAALAVLVPALAVGALSLPYSFTSGTPIRAAEVNANFEALRASIDGLSATRPIVLNSWDPSRYDPIQVEFVSGTAAASISAGSRAVVSITFRTFGATQGRIGLWSVCAQASSGSLIAAEVHEWRIPGITNPMTQDQSALQDIERSLQAVLTIPSAGLYRFGLCFDTPSLPPSAENISVIATIYP